MKNTFSKALLYSVISLLAVFTSCLEVENQEPVILTEGVLFLSGERVRLSGRIYRNGGSEVSDHGFEISSDELFTDPILIKIGLKTSLGSFIGESSELISSKGYYYRAFAIIESTKFYGEAKFFLTLNSTLSSLSPSTASSGDIVKIQGTNFSSKTRVYFGGNEAEIINIELESTIELIVPDISVDTEVIVRVNDGVSDLIFERKFQYIYGTWRNKKIISNPYRFNEPISFSKNEMFIFGLGRNLIDGTLNNTLWEYNIVAESWNKLNFSGPATLGSFYNDDGYFGAGYLGWDEGFGQNPIFSSSFWKYENGVVSYIGELPFQLYQAVSFQVGGKVHVIGGRDSDSDNFVHYYYSEYSMSWDILGDIPILINQKLPHFTFNDFQYFITREGEIWNYNSTNNEWRKIDNAPFAIEEGGVSEVINGKAYIGLFSFDNQVWEYDISMNTWKSKSRIEDGKSNLNAGSFVWNSKMGVVRLNPSGADSDWIQNWEFSPEEY